MPPLEAPNMYTMSLKGAQPMPMTSTLAKKASWCDVTQQMQNEFPGDAMDLPNMTQFNLHDLYTLRIWMKGWPIDFRQLRNGMPLKSCPSLASHLCQEPGGHWPHCRRQGETGMASEFLNSNYRKAASILAAEDCNEVNRQIMICTVVQHHFNFSKAQMPNSRRGTGVCCGRTAAIKCWTVDRMQGMLGRHHTDPEKKE